MRRRMKFGFDEAMEKWGPIVTLLLALVAIVLASLILKKMKDCGCNKQNYQPSPRERAPAKKCCK
jgi:hypothetical protein